MNVLALVTDAFGAKGGIAQYNRDLLTALGGMAAGSRVLVLPRHGNSASGELPPGVSQLPPQRKYRFFVRALRAAVSDGPFDVVFCGHVNLAPLAATIGWALGVPLWLQLHGTEAWGGFSRSQRWSLQRAALITAVSRYTRRRFLGSSRVEPGRVRVLPNVVGASFGPGPKSNGLLDRHGLRGRKVLLTVGRLAGDERGKGQDRVIAALRHLRQTEPDLVYLIVGDGDDRERLQALARQEGVADAVRFAGIVAAQELVDYYRVADLFVMPSTQEGFGIVFLEAAASGLQVIAGRCDGSADALADGVLGRLIDPLDEAQLVAAIREALASGGTQPLRVRRFSFGNFARHLRGLVADHLLQPPAASIVTAGGG